MQNLGLWLRWSWRDLRARWIQIGAVALIIALGISVYAGLGSTTPWRLRNATDSFSLLNMYDLRVRLTASSYAQTSDLLESVYRIEHADWLAQVEPRLIAPTIVNATTQAGSILVRAHLIGVDLADDGPQVNGLHITGGRGLTSEDSGQPVGVLEHHFATYYHLPPQGEIQLSGGAPMTYIGTGMSPEHLLIVTEEGAVMAEASLATLFVSLETAQALISHPGQANDLIIALHPEADREIVQAEIEAALQAAFPTTGFSLVTKEEDLVYELFYQQIEMNQEVYDIIAYLFLGGALLGAFNLASRIVESQRRELGIGMALGMPPRLLIARPLMIGIQVAVLGVAAGLPLALFLAAATSRWITGLQPTPVSGTLFQPRIYLEATGLGFVLPLVATLYPVWRATRVVPVDAIRTGHLVAKGNGLVPLLTRLLVPGKSFVQMPVRNLLRSPRRTIFSILGIATAVTTLIGLVGILDTALFTLNKLEDEAYQSHPDRLNVYLNNLYPVDSAAVAEIAGSSAVAMTQPAIVFRGKLLANGQQLSCIIEALPLGNDLWTPTLLEHINNTESTGVLISQKAASDLGVHLGDTITLEHPRREGLFAFQTVQTQVQVVGIHANPWRTFVYMDLDQTGIMGLENLINTLHIVPAAGVSEISAKEALFPYAGIASILAIDDAVRASEKVMEEVVKFLSWVKLGVFALAFLIAFNSTSINMSEREREIATMFAFGLRIRTVTRMAMLENLLTGILGTLLGIGMGALVMVWFFQDRMPIILPEVGFTLHLAPSTLLAAVLFGIVVVALTPLLLIRRMQRMDIPSTLRVME